MYFRLLAALVFSAILSAPAKAQEPFADLAQQLANPIADLASVPFQLNYDENIGPDDDGSRWTLNIQPVVPFSLNENWNVISRTILPVVSTDGIPPGSGSKEGFGDIIQSFFFSPKAPTANGWILGAGPAFLLPTSTDDRFGAGEWGAGITGIGLKQLGPWTFGGLANHIWDIGDSDTDISNTFLQPFLVYNTETAVTISLNSESTYNWETEEWSAPINLTASKLLKVGNRPISLGAGVRYYADSATTGPEGWGARIFATLLFPK